MEHENEDKQEPKEDVQPSEVKTEEPKPEIKEGTMSKRSWFKKKKKMAEQPKQEEKKQEQVQQHKPQQQVQQKPKKKLFKRKGKKKKQPGELGFFKKRTTRWKRTLEVARKPSKDEFTTSAKITGIGIALLGFIGFIIFMIFHLVS